VKQAYEVHGLRGGPPSSQPKNTGQGTGQEQKGKSGQPKGEDR
jgi:hypothetical protein